MIEPERIFSLGDNAVTVEFGNRVADELNAAAVALSAYFNEHPFPGFIEAVPAMASMTVYYRCYEVRDNDKAFPTAFSAIEARIKHAIANASIEQDTSSRVVEIPVSFAAEDALDLAGVAAFATLSQDEVIEIFTSRTYRVFMLGFLPGFAYMGEVDERIAIPRLKTPRTLVPKGSVGIAGRQTGIYPSESPGGWQIIGRTDKELLTGNAESPSVFQPGDNVRFVRTSNT